MFNKALLLRLHRWVTLTFAIPLLVIIMTGLVLSLEPVVSTAGIEPGSLTSSGIETLLQKFDPAGGARGLTVRPYDRTLSIQAAGAPTVVVDLRSGETVGEGFRWSDVFTAARRLHETLMLGAGWLVIASTYAMLALALLGILMGWPRIRNTVAGWHKATAWFLLPLLLLSPLTGLFLAHGIGASGLPAPASGTPVSIAEAVRLAGASHDLSGLNWVRSLGGRLMVRIEEAGAVQTYAVTREGLAPVGQNWPRLIHEGNFAPIWPGLVNAVISLALAGLLGTGLFMWARRTFRRRPARRMSFAAPKAASP